MKTLLVIAAAFGLLSCGDTTGSASDKPPAHAPVTGPAMYTIRVVEISVQPVPREGEEPTATPRKVEAKPSGISSCRLEKDPGSELVTGWFEGSFNEQGRSMMTHGTDKKLPEEVVWCMIDPAINTNLGIREFGEYRVTVKAYFTDPKPQPARPG